MSDCSGTKIDLKVDAEKTRNDDHSVCRSLICICTLVKLLFARVILVIFAIIIIAIWFSKTQKKYKNDNRVCKTFKTLVIKDLIVMLSKSKNTFIFKICFALALNSKFRPENIILLGTVALNTTILSLYKNVYNFLVRETVF